MNAPRVGGSFAVWGGLFSVFDCSMVYVRQKEDPWNSIIAGAATGGFLQLWQGARFAARSAMFGGVLLALIEGAGIMFNRFLSSPQNFPPMIEEQPGMTMPPNVAAMAGAGVPPSSTSSATEESSNSSSWFGGVFEGKKKEETKSSDGAKTQVLESFDGPSTPVPTFDYK